MLAGGRVTPVRECRNAIRVFGSNFMGGGGDALPMCMVSFHWRECSHEGEGPYCN